MCGRLTLKTPPSQWAQLLLPVLDSEPLWANWQPRYNVAPTQRLIVIAHRTEGPVAAGGDANSAFTEPRSGGVTAPHQATASNTLAYFGCFRWGLVPSWSNDLSIGSRMINARRETLREKKSFIGPLSKRRCLVVADGYYEWQRSPSGGKQPFWISRDDGGMMQLAGLWEVNRRASDMPITTCTIITTAANSSVSSIHDRMPVVLSHESAAQWLSDKYTADDAFELLEPAATLAALKPCAVDTYVNNARHEGPQCLTPM